MSVEWRFIGWSFLDTIAGGLTLNNFFYILVLEVLDSQVATSRDSVSYSTRILATLPRNMLTAILLLLVPVGSSIASLRPWLS